MLTRQKTADLLEKFILLSFAVFLVIVPYSKGFFKYMFAFCAFIWLIANIVRQGKRFYRGFLLPNPLNRFIFIFLGASILSIIFSRNPYHSQSIFFERYSMYFLFFWMALMLVVKFDSKTNKPQEISWTNLYVLIGAFLLSGIILSSGAIWDWLHFPRKRLWTVFGREIPFKMIPLYLTYCLPFSLSVSLFAKKHLRIIGIVSLLLLVVCWFLQASRASWIAVTASMLTIFLFKNKKRLCFALLLGLAIGILLTPAHTQKRFRSIVDPDRWGYRLSLSDTAIGMFKDYPVFGAGIGCYEKLFDEYKPSRKYPKNFQRLHAHSSYLEMLAEMGIVGVFTFLLIFSSFFKNASSALRRCSANHEAILLGLTATVIASLIFAFISSIIMVGIQSAPMFWLLFGIASALTLNAQPRENNAC